MFLRQQARALAGGLGSSLRRAHGAHSDVTRGLLTSQASPADTERRTDAMTPSPRPSCGLHTPLSAVGVTSRHVTVHCPLCHKVS